MSDQRVAAFLTGLVLDRVVGRGTLQVGLDGEVARFGGASPRPTARIDIQDPGRVASMVLRSGSVGFAEAYIDGLWDTPDLATLLELAARNNDHRRGTAIGSLVMRATRRVWKRAMRSPAGPAVPRMVDHYDLGNDFYAQWLDPSMSYSSAIFEDGDDLHQAQLRKYQRLAEIAGIRQGDRVLEIGCGWGSLAEYLAGSLGCSVTALTISAEQRAFVRERIARSGLDDRVDVVLADFREAAGRYDRVVSIEMIESIDEAQWPDLFTVTERSLVPGGTAAMQAITIEHELHEEMIGRDEFIRSYIFPGGALPSIRVLRELVDDAGLDWMGYTAHGPSYARTLAAWDDRFVKAWPVIAEASSRFDDRFFRMWRYYLAYCEAGFRTGRLDGVQVAYQKPRWRNSKGSVDQV